MTEVGAAVFALGITATWLALSRRLVSLAPSPRSPLGTIIRQAAGNFVVAGAALAVLLVGDVDSPFQRPTLPRAIPAIAIGCLLAAPGSRFAARVVRREVATAELAIASMPMRHRVVTLLAVPLSEELLWRAAPITALVALGTPFVLAVAATAIASVAVHASVFSGGGLVKATAPGALGVSVAVAIAGLPAAVAVHVIVDLEILVTPSRS